MLSLKRMRLRWIRVMIRIRTCALHGCFAWLKTNNNSVTIIPHVYIIDFLHVYKDLTQKLHQTFH